MASATVLSPIKSNRLATGHYLMTILLNIEPIEPMLIVQGLEPKIIKDDQLTLCYFG